MKPLPYKHYFTVLNKKYVWEDPQMFELKKTMLNGKRGYAIIEEETEKTTGKQLAYYFGGIIRQECMNSNCFAGWTEKEIHTQLLTDVRGSMRTIHLRTGESLLKEMPGDFESIMNDKKEMAKYLEEVIAKLSVDYDIFVKPSEHYKPNKFRITNKHYK